jgi:hypothetical protein
VRGANSIGNGRVEAHGRPQRIYVRAKHSVRMKGIPEGTYQLAYMAGLDWDDGEAIFRCDPDYAEFERNFVFTEENNQEGVQYHAITVTLHPVVGGNMTGSLQNSDHRER